MASGTTLPCSFRAASPLCGRKQPTFCGVPKAEFDPNRKSSSMDSAERCNYNFSFPAAKNRTAVHRPETLAKRRLAAILAADVVGYSRLVQRDEMGTLAALKSRRKGVLQPLLAKHTGRIIKLTGDGALVEFASAVNAVKC